MMEGVIYYPQARVNVALVPRGGEQVSILDLPVRRATVTHNDIYTADEFEVELDGHHFPADPRVISCMAFDVHIGDVGRPDANLQIGEGAATRLVAGHADQVSRQYRDQNMTFRAKGRDYAGLLLDVSWGSRVVKLERPLIDIVREVLASIPSAARLEIVTEAAFVVPGDPQGKSKKRNTFRAQQNTTIWEALIQIALRAGAIIFVAIDRLVIAAPRTIVAPEQAPLFVEGRNLTSLTVERELGTTDIPNIRVRSFDPATGATIIGTFPKEPRKRVRATKGQKAEEIEWEDHVMKHPAPTVKNLSAIAQSMHTFLAFLQMSVAFETKDMSAFTDAGTRVPLTSLRNGSAVRIHIDRETRKMLERVTSADGVARALEKQGFEHDVAEALARSWRTIDTTMLVDKARHTYSVDDGYSLSVDAVSVLDLEA